MIRFVSNFITLTNRAYGIARWNQVQTMPSEGIKSNPMRTQYDTSSRNNYISFFLARPRAAICTFMLANLYTTSS